VANSPLERLLKGNAPLGMRMAVAEGMLPLEGTELVKALEVLINDEKPIVVTTLKENLQDMPRGFLISTSQHRDTAPELLHFFAEVLVDDDEILQKIILNNSVLDKTLIFSAENGPPSVLEVLAQNRNRMLGCTEILDKLLENSNLSRVSHYALLEFKERFITSRPEIAEEEIEESTPAEAQSAQTELQTATAEVDTIDLNNVADVDLEISDLAGTDLVEEIHDIEAEIDTAEPELDEGFAVPELEDDFSEVKGFDSGWDIKTLVSEVAGEDAEVGDETDGFDDLLNISVLEDDESESGSDSWLGDDLSEVAEDLDFSDEDLDDDDDEKEKVSSDTRIRLMKMSAADKLILAQMGTKQERAILVTDPNKKVAVAVVTGPKMSEFEIQLIAGNRQVYEEVLRAIAKHRAWGRSVNIRRELVLNPKTPLAISTRMLNSLNEFILKDVMKSKELPSALVNQAKRALDIREKRRKS